MGNYKDGLIDFLEANEEKISEKYVAHLNRSGDIYDAVFWFEGASNSLGEKYRGAKEKWERFVESEYEDYVAYKANYERD